MSENPGGTPPRDDEPTTPDPATPATPPPAPAVPPAATPPTPSYGQPPAPGYGQPPGSPYGQPAPGAYPPPPGYGPAPGGYGQAPGGYGQAPPGSYPPPAGGYGPAVPTSPIGESFSYGWRKFTTHGGLFIAAGLIWFVLFAVIVGIVTAVFGGFGELFGGSSNGLAMGARLGLSLGLTVFYAAVYVLGYLIQAAFIRAALNVTEGRELTFGDFFRFPDPGPVALTALVLGAISVVASIIPIFGGLVSLVVNFLLLFTMWFVIDKRLSPFDAIAASYRLVTANLSTTILFYLLTLVVLFVGAILCFVGLLVAVPVVLVATAFLFKRLLADPIAA